MYAMQYQVGLPADYNMQIIRDRVKKTWNLRPISFGKSLKVLVEMCMPRSMSGVTSMECAVSVGENLAIQQSFVISAVSRFRTGLFIASLGDQYPMLMRVALLSPQCRYQSTLHPLCV